MEKKETDYHEIHQANLEMLQTVCEKLKTSEDERQWSAFHTMVNLIRLWNDKEEFKAYCDEITDYIEKHRAELETEEMTTIIPPTQKQNG